MKRLLLEHFRPPLKPHYVCPICLDVLTHPVLTVHCGHNFCAACIEEAVAKRPQCPACIGPLDASMYFPDKKVEREIAAKAVVCANKGCEWSGARRGWEAHAGECPCEMVACDLECGREMKRGELPDHQSGECPHRVVECPHCGGPFRFVDLSESHAPACPKTPLDCMNGCGALVERAEMEKHKGLDCTMEIVECRFVGTGCDCKVRRGGMEEHLQENVVDHMVALQNFAVQVKEQNIVVLEDLKKATQQIDTLKIQHKKTRKQWKKATLQIETLETLLKDREGYREIDRKRVREKEKGDKEKERYGDKEKGDKEKGDKEKGDKKKGDKEKERYGGKEKGDKEKESYGRKKKGDKEKGDKEKGDKEKERYGGKEKERAGDIDRERDKARDRDRNREKEKADKEKERYEDTYRDKDWDSERRDKDRKRGRTNRDPNPDDYSTPSSSSSSRSSS